VVSLANFCPNCGEALGSHGTTEGERRKTARRAYMEPLVTPSRVKKVRRQASKYNKLYAKAYKKLKKQHPRTSFGGLAKKAHKLARKASKGARRRK
jgi:hypothetical protein